MQAENCLLAGPTHELAAAKTGDGLDQPTLELIALHLPLHPLQPSLECQGVGR